MTFRETEKEVSIRAPWGNIAALTWGDPSNPPVLLCPGRIEPCSAFRPLVLRLPQSLFYVAIDLPGNGRSDHLPMGLRFTTFDLIPTIVRVQEHFGWERFAYIGHSLGASIGMWFSLSHPGRLTRVVQLDPVPTYHVMGHSVDDVVTWYRGMYGQHYTEAAYMKHTGGKEMAPKYTYEQAKDMFKKAQGLTDEAAECNLERLLEPAGDGLYRLTYDQRMKSTFTLPFTPEDLRALYTLTDVPTLAVLARDMVRLGWYTHVPFATDESAWPHGNYRYIVAPGNHDLHVNTPEDISDQISEFLLHGRKAKL